MDRQSKERQLDCVLGWAHAQVRKLVLTLSTSVGFTHASVREEFPECPSGNLLFFLFLQLMKSASRYTRHGLNWVLPQSSPHLEREGCLQSSYPDGKGGAPSCWPGASTWHTAKC